MPEWVGDVVWWQVYPLGFLGAPARQPRDGTVVHRLPHLERWLGYAAELGASGLALGPIFASESHGYDTVDHFRIDARLGDLGDFGSLVEAAHDRGLRVLLDGVFDHVGRGFPAFSEVLAQGPAARRANWFDLSWPSGWQPGAEPGYRCFEGHHHLVALNHGWPEVARLRHGRNVPLARPWRGRLAPRRRLRGTGGLLGKGPAPSARRLPGGVVRRRGDPR